ncbi:hypothetical protein FISHEDRAFT_19985, partial [Fistulina hepatica ATCC 64428]
DLWFPDGNVVIKAEDRFFKVMREQLSCKSSMLSDMFSFLRTQDNDMMDGAPVVIFPDTARDMTHFLKAIFVPNYFLPVPAPTTFEIVESVLRMSHRYRAVTLERHALAHLSTAFDTKLEGFLDPKPTFDIHPEPSFESSGDIDFAVVTLARDVGATWILPSAFYEAHLYSVEEICNGVAIPASGPGIVTPDMSLCLAGLARIRRTSGPVTAFMACDVAGCTTQQACNAARMRILVEDAAEWQSDPLNYFRHWIRETLPRRLCSVCYEHSCKVYMQWQQSFWDAVPGYFGLPSWEEL